MITGKDKIMYYSEQKCAFSACHPAVNFTYILSVLTITITTLNPFIIGISCFISLIVWFIIKNEKKLLFHFITAIPIILFTMIIQPIFSNTGTTILFYINDKGITLEAFIYGMIVGIMLITVIQWIGCCTIFIDSEKLYFLFGKIAPVLGLTFSMILRFIPLLQSRYEEIYDAQAAMGRHSADKKSLYRIKQFLKEISILISWSLENSIETSKSMESRGYGLKGRKTYHLYLLKKSDIIIIAVQMAAFALSIWIIFTGKATTYYMPTVILPKNLIWTAVVCLLLTLTGLLPIWYEISARLKRIRNEEKYGTN